MTSICPATDNPSDRFSALAKNSSTAFSSFMSANPSNLTG
jgi:hypothetical protein